MTDADGVWSRTLQDVVGRAAHELKDALNGVALNVEVVRSRASTAEVTAAGVAPFAAAAADQLEVLGRRIEALLVLSRPPRQPVDVGQTLRHLGELLVPAARADGGALEMAGTDRQAPTSAGGQETRLALAAGLLAISGHGARGRCVLEVQTGGAVVRFSHESAAACALDPAVVAALAGSPIRYELSGKDLQLAFPGNS